MMDTFGLRLENLRENIGLTKRELSIKLGFSANVYGSYERGERQPSLETIIKLAEVFNVSLDYLIRGEEHQPTKDLETINQFIKETSISYNEIGIKKPYILQFEEWSILEYEDLKELHDHFEWVVHKAKTRKK